MGAEAVAVNCAALLVTLAAALGMLAFTEIEAGGAHNSSIISRSMSGNLASASVLTAVLRAVWSVKRDLSWRTSSVRTWTIEPLLVSLESGGSLALEQPVFLGQGSHAVWF